MEDAPDSASGGHSPWRFESSLPHHILVGCARVLELADSRA